MDRRGFLKSLTGFLALGTVDPEALLWTPSKTIFIPSGIELVPQFSSFITEEEFIRRSLMSLRRNLQFIQLHSYSETFHAHGPRAD